MIRLLIGIARGIGYYLVALHAHYGWPFWLVTLVLACGFAWLLMLGAAR